MHELSMADAMVKTVLDVAEKNDATEIIEVTIEVGKLTMLNPDFSLMCWLKTPFSRVQKST